MCIILLRRFHFVILMMMSCMLHLVPCSSNITTTVNDNHIESTLLYHTDGDSESVKDVAAIFPSSSQPNKPQTDWYIPPSCPPPPIVPNAQPHVLDPNAPLKVNTTLVYSCMTGYYRSRGAYEIRCISVPGIVPGTTKAKWQDSTLVCQIITCPDPGDVENANKSANGFTYASNISYVCYTGYVMSGAPFLHCTQNGVWNRQLPRCDPIKCPMLENPAIGTIKYSDPKRSYESIATLSCPYKYHVEKSTSLSCGNDGKWIGNLSRCVENFCPNFATSRPGVLLLPKKLKYSIGSPAIATCHDKNRTTIRCKDDGTWDLNGFKCSDPGKKFCSIITPLENGHHNGSSKVTGYSDGVVIAFNCNPNYYRDGPPWIRCRHGSWTSNKPRCVLHEYGSLSRLPSSSSSSSSSNQLTVLGTVLFVILFFILIVLSIILHRLRQRHLEKQYWKRYFGNHTYRQSRTNITATCNQEMRFFCQSRSTVPVTDL